MEKVQIDVDVNMTLEITEGEWDSFVETAMEELEGYVRRTKRRVNAEASRMAAEYALDGEEIACVDGRAWVCSVDRASVM